MDEMQIERKYLQSVIEFLNNSTDNMERENEILKVKIDKLKEYLNHMMKIGADETIKIYEQVSEDFVIVEQHLKKIKKYNQVKKTPYFGKIDIKESGEKESLYIGLYDISDVETGKQFVLDWRAPICSVYYHSQLGNTSYLANGEKYTLELLKKRQLTIKNGELEYFCDTNNKIDDEVLQEILSHNTSSYMENIIKSIQAEQDEVIRQPLFSTVIVDGVAGSGKTSIGMHRIAYLLYENRDKINSENILIISPNELFSQYVSHLLPELGEDSVKTIPFSLLLRDKFNNLRNAESKSDMMENILLKNNKRLAKVQYKYTREYANALLDFLADFNVEKCVGTIRIRNKRIVVPNLKKTYKLSEQNKYKIFKRVNFITETIIEQAFYNYNSEDAGELQKEIKEAILKKIYKAKLFNNFITMQKQLGEENETLVQNNIAYDDIATYAFIEMAINGYDVDNTIKQLFVDEIQDYSPLSLMMLREMYPSATLTIVGDYNQNLVTLDKNLETIKELFPVSKYFKLNNSYRSSNNIMRLASGLIDMDYHTTLSREGEKPSFKRFNGKNELIVIVEELMEKFDKHQKTAIICKTKQEAKDLSDVLTDFTPVFDEKITNSFFENNRIITTVFLSKGLEFDNVIIYNANDTNFKKEIDKQILYTMITRALHTVTVLYEGNLSNLFKIN